VGAARGFQLDFAQAYTLWPGHLRVRDLSLRFEDYNVQFEVALAKADLDIALSQLLFKKFRVTRLVADGTRFRMRHKLVVVGQEAERVAAYPPIKGFADPPYFVGVRPRPLNAEQQDDLWQVRIEDVQARVSELWIMEHRFRGRGMARGSFVVWPTRWVQVEPARLELEDGSLTLGEHLVAKHLRGRITCDIPDMRVPETQGRGVFKEISSAVRLELSGGRLDFLNAYLTRFGGARYSGEGAWLLDLNIVRGVVQRGSSASLRASPLHVSHELARLSGDLTLRVERDSGQDSNQLVLVLDAPRIAAGRAETAAPAPSLEGVAGWLRLEAADLTGELSLGAAEVAVKKLRAPSLAWFEPKGTQLRGDAQAALELQRSASKVISGTARLRVDGAGVRHGQASATGDLQGELAFARAPADAALDMRRLEVRLSNAVISKGEKRTQPFGVRLDGTGLQVVPGRGASARGSVEARFTSAEALLPLVLGAPLKGLTESALDLQGVEARATVDVSRSSVKLQSIDARSGDVRLRGHVSTREQDPDGAFLLSSGPINVGVTLRGGSTSVSPFVGNDWLKTAGARAAR
jgi:hypothetical protein